MSLEQNQDVLMNQEDENVPRSRLRELKLRAKEIEIKERKQKESEKLQLKKKAKIESWRLEDFAQSVGELSKVIGKRKHKTFHYQTFEFHNKQYGLNDSVLLVSEDDAQKPYVGIVKDIYTNRKDGYIKLNIQWYYRPEDVEKTHDENWKSQDSRDLFYSFHQDEVSAESVKNKCNVYFIPENKQIPNLKEHPGFIVHNVYDNTSKKLRKFAYEDFNVEQKDEIHRLVENTISQVGHLPDTITKPEEMSHKSSIMVNQFFNNSSLEKFNSSDREDGIGAEPMMKTNVPSTSKSVGHKDSLEK